MTAQPPRLLAVVRAVAAQQRPEARAVVHHLEVADLVPDDVVEDRLGREQQAPVEAHRAAARAARPAGALSTDCELRVRGPGGGAGAIESRGDLRRGRAA